MAQKAPIDDNIKTPPPAHFEKSLGEMPDNIDGIRPLIESPEAAIKKAVRKSIVISLVAILLTAGAVYFAYGKIIKLSKESQGKQNLIYQASRKNQTNADLLRIWKDFGPKYDQINNILPASNDLLGYTGELEKIAAATAVTQNVQLQTPKTTVSNLPQKTSDKDQVASKKGSSVDYSIELKGNFDQFINYINALEGAPYFTQITSLNLSGGQSLNQNAAASIGAKVYTYP